MKERNKRKTNSNSIKVELRKVPDKQVHIKTGDTPDYSKQALWLIGVPTAIVAVMLAFGVGVQRGAILQMGLGYLNGSYDINEIYYFSALGLAQMFDGVDLYKMMYEMAIENLVLIPVFGTVALLMLIVFKTTRELSTKGFTLDKVRQYIKGKSAVEYPFSTLLGSIVGTFFVFLSSVSVLVIIVGCAFFLMPYITVRTDKLW